MTEVLLPAGWLHTPLSELLNEVDVRVVDLPRDERDLEVLSLTKRWGLLPQSERFDKRVATDDIAAYKVVRTGWIVYNPYVIWEGAVHALRRAEPGVVSPVYPVWERKADDGGFLDLLLRTPELIQEYERFAAGAVNRRRSIRKSDFLSIRVPCPPLHEQRRIARVLWMVQRAIERQERLVAFTAELKEAIIHKLFTEGIRGEPQKQTEIGPVPQSWKVEQLRAVLSRSPSNGLYRPHSDYGRGTRILRIDDFSNDGDIVTTARHRVEVREVDCKRFGLGKDDIVLNRVNSLSHLGKTALIGQLDEPMLFESNMMRFRVDEKRLRPAFAFRVLNSAVCKSQIVGLAKRAVAQSSINQGDVGRLLIPVPPDVQTQDEILEILNALEAKSAVHVRTRVSLSNLFHTLVHRLMTAQVSVHDLDLTALEELQSAGAA
jgi:type I restriction enzyme S subunit